MPGGERVEEPDLEVVVARAPQVVAHSGAPATHSHFRIPPLPGGSPLALVLGSHPRPAITS